jgi:hypothetical protein
MCAKMGNINYLKNLVERDKLTARAVARITPELREDLETIRQQASDEEYEATLADVIRCGLEQFVAETLRRPPAPNSTV